MKKLFDKSVYFEVSTYENLRTKANELIELINIGLEQFLLPLDIPLEIGISKMNFRDRDYFLNEKNLNKTYKMLKEGEIQQFAIGEYYGKYDRLREEFINYQRKSGEGILPSFVLGFICDYYEDVKRFLDLSKNPKIANFFSLSISERFFINNCIDIDVQRKLIDFFKTTYEKINGITGFITFETTNAGSYPVSTPYEYGINSDYMIDSQRFDHNIRGYFWGNVLSKEHINKLGGIEKIKQNAPCYKIEELTNQNGKAVYLQLTESINEYSDEMLMKLRGFFDPVLLKGERRVEFDPYNSTKTRYRNGFITRLLPEDFPIIKTEL